jgi:hypothetical protein
MHHGCAGPSQLFLQLVGEALGGEVRCAHTGNLNHRLSIAESVERELQGDAPRHADYFDGEDTNDKK